MCERKRCKWILQILAIGYTAGAQSQPIDPSCFGATIEPDTVCPGEQTDPAAATNDPSAYAWAVFAQINRPAFSGHATDSRRVWETWKSADDNTDPDDAIYLDDGTSPKPWNVAPRSGPVPKTLVPLKQLELLDQQQIEDMASAATRFFSPSNPLREEVRTNRPAFNFILKNTLYNQQGQYQYASVNQGFNFPLASKEVKAIWREAPAGIDLADYYQVKTGGKTYVLVSMHLVTKDLPFWFWASFVHKDQNKDLRSGYAAALASNQDPPASLRGTPFANYRLIAELTLGSNGKLVPSGNGAQTDWISRIGEATVLGNPNIEIGFEQQSSCITCHAHASIGRKTDGHLAYNRVALKVGSIDPKDLNANGTTFFPLDFLWSLRKAKSTDAPPRILSCDAHGLPNPCRLADGL
jgi:hypothetical protein